VIELFRRSNELAAPLLKGKSAKRARLAKVARIEPVIEKQNR
jgi:hypothetical protein